MITNSHREVRDGRAIRFQRWVHPAAGLLLIALTGCRSSPTFNILGSFFPSWLVCLFGGILIAVVLNRVFARFALGKEILWPVVVYPCLALLFACLLWLIFFS
jgi:YtcA family